MKYYQYSSDGQTLFLETPYNEALIAKIRDIPGRKWNPNNKRWEIPLSSAERAIKLVDRYYPPEQKPPENSFVISKGSGYGGSPYKVGQIIKTKNGFVKVISTNKRYYSEDGMSFGVGDESGYVYSARVVQATEEESKPIIESDKKDALKIGAKERLNTIKKFIVDKDNLSPVINSEPEGETYLNTFNIYGAGNKWLITKDHIWYIRNNGMDGDNWGSTNIGNPGYSGSIGWRVPYNENLANEIKILASINENPSIDGKLPKPTDLSNLKPGYKSEILEGAKYDTTPGTMTELKGSEYSKSALKDRQTDRTVRAQSADVARTNKIVVMPGSPRVAIWVKDPGRMDVQGIDTPHKLKMPKSKVGRPVKVKLPKTIKPKRNLKGLLHHRGK